MTPRGYGATTLNVTCPNQIEVLGIDGPCHGSYSVWFAWDAGSPASYASGGSPATYELEVEGQTCDCPVDDRLRERLLESIQDTLTEDGR